MNNTENFQSYFDANKNAWNKRTTVHKESDFYNVASFINGTTSLNKTELDELGSVKGKSLLHLQCHFGLDTLSWAREGAVVTGVDLSDEAIAYAKKLSAQANITAEFITCNIYDLKQHLNKEYDIVFTSYGVIGWLPDLNKWASIISHFLKPGGTFYIAEFHPVVWMLDDNLEYIKYAYHNAETIIEHKTGTYANRESEIEYDEYSWNHSLSEVINSLLNNGLQIEFFNEYPFSHYNCFNNLQQDSNGYWYPKKLAHKIPMMYSIKAIKTKIQ
jgi:2-polyprenyl-3-methyl-5-hydroxy-6-metoxy-1,4-benzoquinol methylase